MMQAELDHSTQASLAETILPGGGESGALMRALDWTRTAVGPISAWPQSLRTAVTMILESKFPMAVAWGTAYTFFYNDPYRPILGASKHPAAMGRPIRDIFPEIWDFLNEMFGQVMAGQAVGYNDLFLALDRNGYLEECYFTFSYSPLRDEAGAVGGVLVTVSETTERVISERRLRILRDLASTVSTVSTAEAACAQAAQLLANNNRDFPFALIYLVDADGREAHLVGLAGLPAGHPASPASFTLGRGDEGWPLTQVAQTQQTTLVTDLHERFGALPGGQWPESPQSALVLPITYRGQDRPYGLLVTGISPRRALDDGYKSFLSLVADQIAAAVSNARAYEQERRRAEALAELDQAKTTFFSNVSHEFRTPLTLLLGPLEDALAGTATPSEQQERLQIAHRNAVRLLKLVNTLLDFSRIEASRAEATYEPVDLATTTAELASVFRSAVERAGLRFVVDCPPLPEPIYVDRDMWEKIVLNLLSNAFKFTLQGEIQVILAWRNHQAELAVRDTGVGIPAGELGDIFTRFHRVRGAGARTQEGTGIGLALVQELVRLHGGTIQVVSQLGQGSTFTVTIPSGKAHLPPGRISVPRTLASTGLGAAPFLEEALRWLPGEAGRPGEASIRQPLAGDEPTGAASWPPDEYPAQILLVDDNADMRNYLRRLLGGRWSVHEVADVPAALASVRHRLPDLVLSDVMLPGPDGFELLRALRRNPDTAAVPVILLSARAGEEARVDGLNAGADDYIVKPFLARELIARVYAQLQLARLRAELAQRERGFRIQLESVLQQMPAGVVIAEAPSGRPIIVNDHARQMTGYAFDPPLEIEQRTVLGAYRVLYPDGRPYPAEALPLARAMRQGEVVTGEEIQIEIADGRRLTALANAAPIRNASDDIIAGIVTFVDITHRKRTEGRLARLQAVTAALSQALTSADVAAVVLHEGAAAMEAGATRLFLIGSDGQELTDVASFGYPAEILAQFPGYSIGAPNPVAEAARTGAPVWLESAQAYQARYPHLAEVITAIGYQAAAMLPLRYEGRLLGVLALSFTRPLAFGPDEQSYFCALADYCAQALERARLYQAEQEARLAAESASERLRHLQQVTARLAKLLTPRQVFEVTLGAAVEVLRAAAGSVWLASAEGQPAELAYQLGYEAARLKAYQHLPPGARSPASDAVRLGEAIWLESDADWQARYPELAGLRSGVPFHAIAVLPLADPQRVVGAMSLSFGEPRTFSDEERSFLWALARQCALALDQARLYEAERQARLTAERASGRLGGLLAVSAALLPAVTQSQVIDVIITHSAATLGASACGLYLLEQDPPALILAGSIGHPESLPANMQRLTLDGDMPGADVFRRREPLWIRSNAELIERYPQIREARQGSSNEALAAIPLLSNDHVLGILALSFATAREFEPADRDFLLAVAGQCALALERTQLYESERRLNAELDQRFQARTAELLQSEGRFHLLVNSVQDYAIFMLDPQGYVMSWNTGAQRLKGYTADEVIGQHFSRFYTPEDAARGRPMHALAVAAREGRYEVEGWRLRHDGSRFWADVIISAVRDETGALIGFAKVTRDLTERRQAEARLRESQRQLEEAQHLARLGSLHWNMSENTVTWSDELLRIYGVTPETRPAKLEQFLALVHPDDRGSVQQTVRRALVDHQPFAFDHRIVDAGGAIRTLHVEGRFELDEQGRPIALAAASQDITERKQIEEEVRQSREQLRQLSTHLERVREEERRRLSLEIHDQLGGALTGLKMDIARSQRSMPENSKVLGTLSAAVDQAIQLVRRIATELRPPILDDFGLVAAIDELVREFGQRVGIATQFDAEPDTFDLDPDVGIQVYRVVQESLTNIARHAQATSVRVAFRSCPGCAMLSIEDNGRGFEMIEARQKHSLGLAGMQERVRAFAGELEIKSAPGHGTVIMVKIPTTEPTSSTPLLSTDGPPQAPIEGQAAA